MPVVVNPLLLRPQATWAHNPWNTERGPLLFWHENASKVEIWMWTDTTLDHSRDTSAFRTRIPCNQWVWPLYLAINRVFLMAQLLIMNPQFCRDNDTWPTVFVNDCDRFLDIWYSPMFAHICIYIYTCFSLSLYICIYIYRIFICVAVAISWTGCRLLIS